MSDIPVPSLSPFSLASILHGHSALAHSYARSGIRVRDLDNPARDGILASADPGIRIEKDSSLPPGMVNCLNGLGKVFMSFSIGEGGGSRWATPVSWWERN